MKNWYRLNLPEKKLTDAGIYLAANPAPVPGFSYQCIEQPSLVLSQDILDIFQKLNIEVWFVAFFAMPTIQTVDTLTRQLIHCDMSSVNDKWVTGGISFEVNPTTVAHFRWFDMNENLPVYPTRSNGVILNGIHYGKRGQKGVLPGVKEIEQIEINQPTLCRTDVPHTVTYRTTVGVRCGVSIRFNESLNSWESLVDTFSPIIER